MQHALYVLLLFVYSTISYSQEGRSRIKPTNKPAAAKPAEPAPTPKALPTLSAQNTSYSGKAKYLLDQTYTVRQAIVTALENDKYNAANTKLENLKRNLDKIKTTDASFNINELENDYNVLLKYFTEHKEDAAKIQKAQADAWWAENNNKNDLHTILEYVNFTVSEHSIHLVQSQIDQYTVLAKNLLARKPFETANTSYTKEEFYTIVDEKIKNTNLFLNSTTNTLAEFTNYKQIETSIYKLKIYMAYWDAATSFFPEKNNYKEMQNLCKKMYDETSDSNLLKKKAEQNNLNQIKSRKLPNAAVRDVGLEQFAKTAFMQNFGTAAKASAVLRVVIVGSDWIIKRHEVSGVITGRTRTVRIAIKSTNGKCYLMWENAYIYEDYIGGKFTGRKLTYAWINWNPLEMLCENIGN